MSKKFTNLEKTLIAVLLIYAIGYRFILSDMDETAYLMYYADRNKFIQALAPDCYKQFDAALSLKKQYTYLLPEYAESIALSKLSPECQQYAIHYPKPRMGIVKQILEK